MSEYRISLDGPLAEDHGEEVSRRVYFASPAITDFELVLDEGQIVAIVVRTGSDVDPDALAAKVRTRIDRDVRGQRAMATRRLWRSATQASVSGGVLRELEATGAAADLGVGRVAMAGIALEVFDGLDRLIRERVREAFDPTEVRYPTLIATDVLARAGYFSSFPQHLMFATRLDNDTDNYESFDRRYATAGRIDETVLELCGAVDHCLPPTMCYHTFGHYAGRTILDKGLHVVTSCGKSFRYESRYAAPFERLWDFTIREVVFFGARDETIRARRAIEEVGRSIVDDLELTGWSEVANDPFFGRGTQERLMSQRLLDLKHELCLDTGTDRPLAVASFNLHDDNFTSRFDIKHNGADPATSACAGFGLERFTYAMLCQHGLDPTRWPDSARRLLPTTEARRMPATS